MRTCKFLTACVLMGVAGAVALAQPGEKLPILDQFQGTVANDKKPEFKTGFVATEWDASQFRREPDGESLSPVANPLGRRTRPCQGHVQRRRAPREVTELSISFFLVRRMNRAAVTRSKHRLEMDNHAKEETSRPTEGERQPCSVWCWQIADERGTLQALRPCARPLGFFYALDRRFHPWFI